ncbi:hypothetical protein B0H17DRAFT_1124473 [Mycena rosella]|uniref:Uncharacterized protein n=1 Tax=Mycena rosella TaxID=1033263 RepID=A0AAD7GZQ2_MYCRO|nr:hypothetical protein B0H17DRAFT_1124473 [Mycena rosella]
MISALSISAVESQWPDTLITSVGRGHQRLFTSQESKCKEKAKAPPQEGREGQMKGSPPGSAGEGKVARVVLPDRASDRRSGCLEREHALDIVAFKLLRKYRGKGDSRGECGGNVCRDDGVGRKGVQGGNGDLWMRTRAEVELRKSGDGKEATWGRDAEGNVDGKVQITSRGVTTIEAAAPSSDSG